MYNSYVTGIFDLDASEQKVFIEVAAISTTWRHFFRLFGSGEAALRHLLFSAATESILSSPARRTARTVQQ